MEKLLTVKVKVTTMLDIWQRLMTYSKGMGGRLNQSWVRCSTVQMCFPLHCMVKWICWRSIILAVTSAAESLVKRSQKNTRCYKKHGEKQHSQSNTYEGYSPLKNGHTYGQKWKLWWLLSLTWRVLKATTWICVCRIPLQHLHHVVCQKCPYKWFLVPGFWTSTLCHS